LIQLTPELLYMAMDDVPDKDLAKAYVKAREVERWLLNKSAYGIAFNQLGLPYRVFVVKKPRKLKLPSDIFINPTFEGQGDQFENSEGCLSFPKEIFKVMRYPAVWLRWYSPYDQERKECLVHDMGAIVAQHEIAHLDGKPEKEAE